LISIFIRCIKCGEVKVIYVPQYESLKLEAILGFALTHKVVVDSLPPVREIWKMPRTYVCNVIFTRLGDVFQKWVDTRCHQRNLDIAVEKDLNIELDVNIAKAFHASTAISCKIYLKLFLLIISFFIIVF
jgi:hypothetical protein